jgi:hypothetical protein
LSLLRVDPKRQKAALFLAEREKSVIRRRRQRNLKMPNQRFRTRAVRAVLASSEAGWSGSLLVMFYIVLIMVRRNSAMEMSMPPPKRLLARRLTSFGGMPSPRRAEDFDRSMLP